MLLAIVYSYGNPAVPRGAIRERSRVSAGCPRRSVANRHTGPQPVLISTYKYRYISTYKYPEEQKKNKLKRPERPAITTKI